MNKIDEIRDYVERELEDLGLKLYVENDGNAVCVSAIRRADLLRSGICVCVKRSSSRFDELPGMAVRVLREYYEDHDRQFGSPTGTT